MSLLCSLSIYHTRAIDYIKSRIHQAPQEQEGDLRIRPNNPCPSAFHPRQIICERVSTGVGDLGVHPGLPGWVREWRDRCSPILMSF